MPDAPPSPSDLRSADDVDALAAALYGAPPPALDGVLHVTAVAEVRGARRVIKIGQHSPKSALDLFCLHLARARVDAILVSGQVLRDEPTLRYELPPPLRAWRARRRPEPPTLVVLSRGALPAQHPVWSSEARLVVVVPPDAAPAARASLPDRVEVVGVDDTRPRAVLAWLRRERGARAISVEAGPSVAVPLYETPAAIDELTLSVYRGALDPRAEGAPFPDEATLAASLTRVGGRVDGDWSFSRWVSRPARPGTSGGSR